MVNVEAVKSDIRAAIITKKANACPMIIRLAWHQSGTYDMKDGSGGSNGAGMRFAEEAQDPANAGLSIVRDMLLPVKAKHPEISFADLWTLAGAAAVEWLGGPSIKHNLGRSDAPNASKCPAHGRLPDAAQGAQHLRDVFHRQGFDDREIVALSGAHTLGRCHVGRSGFDGPWTNNPLKFDNQYFKVLNNLTWQERKWDGPLQYEDKETQELMMLPTDLALIQDPEFHKWVKAYAADEKLFFADFAKVFSKLMSNGAPKAKRTKTTAQDKVSAEFREHSMHGSLDAMKKMAAKGADVHSLEADSGRSALHKAAFWGHENIIDYLLNECKVDPNALDYNGDTAAHDAARFGHSKVVALLVKGGCNPAIKNKEGKDVAAVATEYGKADIAAHVRSKL